MSRIARILSTGYFTTTPVAAPAPQPVRPRRLLAQPDVAPRHRPRGTSLSHLSRFVSALVLWTLQPEFLRLSSHVDRPTGLVALMRLLAVFAGASCSWSPNINSRISHVAPHVSSHCKSSRAISGTLRSIDTLNPTQSIPAMTARPRSPQGPAAHPHLRDHACRRARRSRAAARAASTATSPCLAPRRCWRPPRRSLPPSRPIRCASSALMM